ncbi:hypothetical protein FHE72_20460 [Rossellomorea vietnamensis]|uniref:Uncharacterized protein n=1 Tax=Rossellomorea vietnamensis TaxID=218284 RepID=A0A6I6UJI5_9BACI|nr:hypothetical protein [Rossellomorea vietnamensis]QHE63114.1 hypothetical protein FHE72_20460 [Rossellomorea vietnamensis]
MALDEETYETIDEYLESAVKVIEQMYKEHGEKVFGLLEDEDHFDDFRERTYELTEEISDEDLEFFKDSYMRNLNEKLKGEVTPIAVAKKNYFGKLEYDLKVYDSTIILHKRGRRVEWGSNTPVNAKSIINDIVMR